MSARRPAARRWPGLLALGLISAASVGYETALTRYFAVSKWSEYGYWVISITMAGLALSGVAVALGRSALLRHQARLMAWLPVALIVAGAAGYWLATGNGFNPLQLQNPATYAPQLVRIGLYYLELLPYFFLTGLYVSLSFVLNPDRVGAVYASDLCGAGAGALLVLGLMHLLHPFNLVPALLAVVAAAALLRGGRRVALAALLALLGAELLLLAAGQAAYNDFKPIYAPLHVPGGQAVATLNAPRGQYTMMRDFTERVDTDISNDAAMLGLPGPPTAYGVYRDGNRIAALPKTPIPDTRYAAATLAALPYALRPGAAVLLAGASGGFRASEALALGAARVTALEPDPVLRAAERGGWGPAPPSIHDPRVILSGRGPVAAARSVARYDIIDLSGDFLDESEVGPHAFTANAIRAYLRALRPGGVLSVPVSIREFPAYAVRMLATVRAGLGQAGMADPPCAVVAVRSAWNVRILVQNRCWPAAEIAAARKWADDRSFDVSYYPGIDVAAARATIYNDLPPVSFERGEVMGTPGSASDAVADEALAALAGRATASAASFDLAPITEDRPFYYDVLRLDHLRLILRRIETLPQAEIGPLVNIAILLQALLLALLVLAVPALPALARRGGGAGRASTKVRAAAALGAARCAVYFAALGLGFLFIEITAIEKAAFLLNDRASAFAIVLTAMLVGSGLGSLASIRLAAVKRRALAAAVCLVMLWCALLILFGDRAILAAACLASPLRAGLVVLALAPVAVALGLPFPLALDEAAAGAPYLLPWAWAVNGAFSVVSTPLANLIALSFGFSRVLLAAIVLYGLACLVFPARKRIPCPDPPSAA